MAAYLLEVIQWLVAKWDQQKLVSHGIPLEQVPSLEEAAGFFGTKDTEFQPGSGSTQISLEMALGFSFECPKPFLLITTWDPLGRNASSTRTLDEMCEAGELYELGRRLPPVTTGP